MFKTVDKSGKQEAMPIGCSIGMILGIFIVPTIMILGIIKLVELIKVWLF